MDRLTTDIFVSGGGIAGLVTAAACAARGLSVTLPDPKPVISAADEDGSDLRSTAILQPGKRLLEGTGLWPHLEAYATPLSALRAIDTVGWPPDLRGERLFEASDLGEGPFGWNIPNWLIRRELARVLASAPGVDLRLGATVARILQRRAEGLVWLDDGTRISTKLIVAADGRGSRVREAAGIPVQTTRYGQKALAFTVTHETPHQNISTEIYNEGGAFTLVPIADHQGSPASAVVWMNPGPTAEALLAMDRAPFEDEMTTRSCHWLGRLSLASPRRIWPIVTQRAERLTGERLALVAEAAHVMPPIGAQGLNTSLHDISALASALPENADDIGGQAMLKRYEAARLRDIHARAAVIDLFNRICRSGQAPLQSLRYAGLRAVHDITPLRRSVMRAGLGA